MKAAFTNIMGKGRLSVELRTLKKADLRVKQKLGKNIR